MMMQVTMVMIMPSSCTNFPNGIKIYSIYITKGEEWADLELNNLAVQIMNGLWNTRGKGIRGKGKKRWVIATRRITFDK